MFYKGRYDEGPPKPFKAFLYKHVWDDRFQKCAGDSSGLFICDNCASIFKRKADLRRHEISQHFEFKHLCDVCGKKFTRLESLLLHLRNFHDKNEKTFQCDECDYTCARIDNLTNHRTIMHAATNKLTLRHYVENITWNTVENMFSAQAIEKSSENQAFSTSESDEKLPPSSVSVPTLSNYT